MRGRTSARTGRGIGGGAVRALVVAGIEACSGPGAGSEDASAGATTSTTSSTGTDGVSSTSAGATTSAATTSTTTGAESSTTSDSCSFLACTADGGSVIDECDHWAQDCPEGEKCAFWANDGGLSWNSTKCVPVAPDPDGVGEPCTVEGNAVSGVDSCEKGAMCWNVDPRTKTGKCIAICAGDAYECSSFPNECCPDGSYCVISSPLTAVGYRQWVLSFSGPGLDALQEAGEVTADEQSGVATVGALGLPLVVGARVGLSQVEVDG